MSEPILLQSRNIYEQQAHNRRMTWLVVSSIVLLFAVLGLGFDYFYLGIFSEDGIHIPLITIGAIIVSVGFAFFSLHNGASAVLKSAHALPVDPKNVDHHQLLNIVQEISIASGLPAPHVYIIPDEDPNAFATGRDPQHSFIAVTQGLLAILDRDELQGVIAHEMSHIRYYDIRLMTTVAAFVGAIVLLADITLRGLRFGIFSGKSSRSKEKNPFGALLLVLWLLTALLAPIITQLMAMMISRKREYLADASAAELTRNPLALAKALQKLENSAAPTASIKRGIAHLCVVDPLGKRVNEKEGFWAELFATHPPMGKRIIFLNAMAYQQVGESMTDITAFKSKLQYD
jgi:heat shock protein HtpX